MLFFSTKCSSSSQEDETGGVSEIRASDLMWQWSRQGDLCVCVLWSASPNPCRFSSIMSLDLLEERKKRRLYHYPKKWIKCSVWKNWRICQEGSSKENALRFAIGICLRQWWTWRTSRFSCCYCSWTYKKTFQLQTFFTLCLSHNRDSSSSSHFFWKPDVGF